MTALTKQTLRGVWGSVLLPIDADDGIDWHRLADEVAVLAESGLDGVYAHGTAGEFHLLDDDEFARISELLARECGRTGMAYQLGASHPVPQTTLGRIGRTRALEPGAYQVVLPDWLPLTEAECAAFLRRVAEVADPVPLVLYQPPHAKTLLAPDALERLLEDCSALIGLKVADEVRADGARAGAHDWYAEMGEVMRRCAVFVPGHHIASGIARGARGSYSNVAALSPAGAMRWAALTATDAAAAADVEVRLAEFMRRHIAPLQRRGVGNPALDKFLAAVGGWADIGLRVRWPYDSAPQEAVGPARRDAEALLPELIG